MSKGKEEGKGRSLEDVLSELSKYDELKAEAKAHIESQIAVHQADIDKLRGKLADLGFGSQSSQTTRARKTSDGERKQRTCARCSKAGHRYSTCPNEPTAEWLASDRGKDFEATKGK